MKKASVSDEEIAELFGVIDADQSGAIDAEELQELLTFDLESATMTFGPFYSSIFELVQVWVPRESEDQYVLFLQAVFDKITTPVNGHTLEEDLSLVEIFGIDVRASEGDETGMGHPSQL